MPNNIEEKLGEILAEVFKDGLLETRKSGDYNYADKIKKICQLIQQARQEMVEEIEKLADQYQQKAGIGIQITADAWQELKRGVK